MATIPHESFRLKLESMIQTGQSIAERLSKSKISAGKVGLAGAIGKVWIEPQSYVHVPQGFAYVP